MYGVRREPAELIGADDLECCAGDQGLRSGRGTGDRPRAGQASGHMEAAQEAGAVPAAWDYVAPGTAPRAAATAGGPLRMLGSAAAALEQRRRLCPPLLARA